MKYFMALIALLIAGGCTSTLYQCEDGTVVSSLDSCVTKTCPACQTLDCGTCPPKIEYKEKIVEKPVIQTKVETKVEIKKIYVCPDGVTEVAKTADCTVRFLSDAEYGLGDSVLAGDFRWKFVKYSQTQQIGDYLGEYFVGVKADGVFLVIEVEVENIGKSANILSDSYVKLVDEQNREFSVDSTAALYLKGDGQPLMFDTVNPGIVKKGKLVYDVPSGLKVAKLRISSNLLEDSVYNVKLFS